MYPDSNDKLYLFRIIQTRPVNLDHGASLFVSDSLLKGKKLTPPHYRMDESFRICLYHEIP